MAYNIWMYICRIYEFRADFCLFFSVLLSNPLDFKYQNSLPFLFDVWIHGMLGLAPVSISSHSKIITGSLNWSMGLDKLFMSK